MLRYLGRRLAYFVPVWLGLTLLTFGLANLAPGDPAVEYLRRVLDSEPTPEQVAQVRHEFGLDRPFPLSYALWLGRAVQGDLGTSYRNRAPVAPQLAERLPATLELAVPAALLALGVAVPLGALAAARRGSALDHLCRVVTLLGASLPGFWLALLLITFFSVQLRLLPVAGRGGPESVVLPCLTLAAGLAAVLTRLTRAGLLEALGEDYVRTARAKGLRARAVVLRHGLPNALIAVVSALGVAFGHLLGGAAIVETIFAWPGLGKLALDSIYARDYPMLQAYVLVTGTVFLLVNLLVDVGYVYLDPRVRVGARAARG